MTIAVAPHTPPPVLRGKMWGFGAAKHSHSGRQPGLLQSVQLTHHAGRKTLFFLDHCAQLAVCPRGCPSQECQKDLLTLV
uniref:Uncharacterized protein n=1 Tax=Anguilla anguilla TaxID=7936 RepID=A0A0E9PDC2_ANGAN